MRIIRFAARNIKRLKAIEIVPTGAMVEVTGRNGQGKTSVLDAIFWALAGTRSHQDRPIRDGQTHARIELDLGDVIVTRKFRDAGDGHHTTSLQVTTAEGASYPSPQGLLDSLLGTLSFDPLRFMRSRPQEQLTTLSRFVDGVDVHAEQQANKADFQERRDHNRDARNLKAAADDIDVPDDAPTELVSVVALAARLREATDHNAAIDAETQRRETARAEIEDRKRRADEMRAKLEAFEALTARLERDERDSPKLDDRADVERAAAALERAEADGAAYAARCRRDELLSRANDAAEKARALTARMEDRQERIRAAIAAAPLPVDGLDLTDDGPTLRGVPLDQASDAEQLRLSCAIAMAENAKLRVIRVRDGSLLDSDSLELLREMADDRDYQVWIERVDESGDVGFVIEDGSLVAS